jgi:hypothetical protein
MGTPHYWNEDRMHGRQIGSNILFWLPNRSNCIPLASVMPGSMRPQAFPQLNAVLSNPALVGTFFAPINAAVDQALAAFGTSVAEVAANPEKYSYIEQVGGDGRSSSFFLNCHGCNSCCSTPGLDACMSWFGEAESWGQELCQLRPMLWLHVHIRVSHQGASPMR